MDSTLRTLRVKKGLGIDVAAKHLGISGGYLAQIEKGERNVDLNRAHEIASLYGVPIEEVFYPRRYAVRKA